MDEDARADLAAIRQAIDDGRRFAAGGGGYMILWGGVIGLGQLATYATVRARLGLDLDVLWATLIPLAWAATLLLVWREIRMRQVRTLASRVLSMTWFGCGITLSVLYLATVLTGGFQPGWFLAISAGTMGIGFFATSYYCAYGWMRGVAIAWWLGEAACFAWRSELEILVLSGIMMLLLLALPGIVLLRRPEPALAEA
ncbi:MAG: hypothetical protein HY060_13740 [Proteobacteria bacterium]|nr:hypothetical protein [Pseudomonadota bacterium]